MDSEFGRKLRVRREAAKMSLQDLADRAGLQKMTVARLEWGSRRPLLETALHLAEALGITVGELIATDPGPDLASRHRKHRPRR